MTGWLTMIKCIDCSDWRHCLLSKMLVQWNIAHRHHSDQIKMSPRSNYNFLWSKCSLSPPPVSESEESLTKSRLMTVFSVYFGCSSLCSVRECLDSVSILSHSSYKQQYFKMLLSSSFLLLPDTWILSGYCSSHGHTKTTSTCPVNQIVNHRSFSSTSSVA